MSKILDDSIGSEFIAEDERSVFQRMNNNAKNSYTIKMKSDLQNRKETIFKQINEPPNKSQTLTLKNSSILNNKNNDYNNKIIFLHIPIKNKIILKAALNSIGKDDIYKINNINVDQESYISITIA